MRRCFYCNRMVPSDSPEAVMCQEHLFAAFLCSARCYVEHMKKHEAGGTIK